MAPQSVMPQQCSPLCARKFPFWIHCASPCGIAVLAAANKMAALKAANRVR